MSQDMNPESDAAARQRRLEALRALATNPSPTPSPASKGVSDAAPAMPPATSGEVAPAAPPPAPSAPPDKLAGMVVRGTKQRRAAHSGRSSWWLRGGLALLAVCVVAGGVLLYLRRTPPPKPMPDPVSILFNSATMGCPQFAAWAPDGSRVAVLGYVACGGPDNSNVGPNGEVANQPNTGGSLLIYDATSGHLDTDITLDTATEAVVPQSVRSDPTQMRNVGLNYDQLIWSPNGREVAVRFSAGATTLQNGQFVTTDYGQGLLLVTVASHDIKLLSQPTVPQFNYPASSFDSVLVMRWDLNAGTSSYATVPQALAYQWNADGTLAPSLALPTTVTAPAPQAPQGAVGNPDGGKAFTAWQSGFANFSQVCNAPTDQVTQPTCCPVTSYVNAGYWSYGPAWSPDGRFLIIPYNLGLGAMGKLPAPAGTLALPTPGCPLPGQETSTNLVNLPTRDAAMTAIVNSLVPVPDYTQQGPTKSLTGASSANFTWSPDGTRVVVNEQSNGPELADTPVFSLYDTTTGAQTASFTTTRLVALGHLPTNELYKGQSLSFSVMAWSPDSQRLLLLDTNEHALVVLGPKSLKG